MSFHSYAHSILWFTIKLASNSSAGGGSPTSFFNSNYLFMLPSGQQGKRFVNELTRLYQAFNQKSTLESVSIKAAMCLPLLVLQKPHAKSKTKDHIMCLKRRLDLWEEGDFSMLLMEGKMIQRRLNNTHRNMINNDARIARTFAKLMNSGKIRAATQLLSRKPVKGTYNLDDEINDRTVREILKEKHPNAKPANPDVLLQASSPNIPESLHYLIFEDISSDDIRQAALHTVGSAGPSGLDAMAWRRLCTSFGDSSNGLCEALASFAKRISTSYVDPSGLTAYTASRLIPLNKYPGIRPIRVGEVCRRIVGKVIMKYAKADIREAVGPLQLCGGFESGCEAAFHAMSKIYKDDDTEAMLFVDASNAFNQLNREATLINSQVVCPSLAPSIINTYRNSPKLYVDGESILSHEGTTQGDPLGLAIYAIGTKPLIERLMGIANQVWYADDSAAGAKLEKLKDWWDQLNHLGPLYGYLPNNLKTKLLVKSEYLSKAEDMFGHTGVQVCTDGGKYLGGAIGDNNFFRSFIQSKVEEWTEELETLINIAQTQPQAAYAAYTHGIVSKWNYVFRISDLNQSASDILQPLEHTIRSRLLPALTGQHQPNNLLREVFSLPPNLGGLGIANPTLTATQQHQASVHITRSMVENIQQQSRISQSDVMQAKADIRAKKRSHLKQQAEELLPKLPTQLQRCVKQGQEKGASLWLTVLPIQQHDYVLHKSDFKDAIALRYSLPLQRTPSHCKCGCIFSVEHALSCATGGYPSIRHNEVRDLTASMLKDICHDVCIEPHLQPLSGEVMSHRSAITDIGARLDISARGFWGGRFERSFFDVRVFNPSARSNRTSSMQSVYRKHEMEKKRCYEQRVLEVEHASFTPLVMSTTGGMGNMATTFYSRLASMLGEKRGIPYSKMVEWVRCKLSFALLRMSILCVRGSRSTTSHPTTQAIDVQIAEGRQYNNS